MYNASTPSKQVGFTLIEVLIVVAIISVMTSVILFSIDLTGTQKARTLAKEIRFTMRYASDEAILTGTPHAIELSKNSRQLTVLTYAQGGWKKSQLTQAIKWGEAINISLVVGDAVVEEKDEDEEGGKSEKPYVLFWSTGLWEPTGGFRMTVDGLPYMELNWTASGKMEQNYLERNDEQF